LLINWQFWRKNANYHEKSIFTTDTDPILYLDHLSMVGKSQIPLRYLVGSWSATSFEPASNQIM